ncbi:TonB-dependent siderophore receptor [Chitinophaga alhagiae]|uniref:TonB-dependent siderophore receptor n=1 Tax=Chitinophaga alhagiae TaxID=2203219 RepID=A0ABM6W9N8_9BACT|nr:TonB-dependent receptor [Chitinophaga alhagiae]AWO00659.1 TonB-dependent siderophore receptor [Chitinophaga alhagiae]
MRIFTIVLWLFCAGGSYAQSVNGTVRDQENNLVPGVSVVLGKGKNAVTDADGRFSFSEVAPGKYTLRFTFLGYEPSTRSIDVKAGETRVVDVVLTSSAEQLQSVEITGRKESGYKNTNSFVGTKTATALKDVPQSISYVTKELMYDQQAMRVGDVVKYMSGVNQYTAYDDFTIRGFRTQNNSSVQLLNGLRTITGFWKQPLTNYLERVEVIKGPAAALFGNSSPGGIINRVTKKPLREKRQSISFTTGSFNTFRTQADFTGPLNESRTLLYRLNLGYENAQSFRDLQFDKNFIVAPSISFIPTDKTQVNFDVVYNRSMSRLDRGQAVFGNNDIYSTPISKSLNAVNDRLNEDNLMITASLIHKFSDKVNFNLAYLRTAWDEDLLEHRSSNTYAKDSAGLPIPTLVEMQVFDRRRRMFSDNISSYFTFDVNTGPVNHKLLAGYDFAQSKTPWGASQLTASGYRNNTNTGAGSYNAAQPGRFLYETVNGIRRPVPNVPHFDLTAASPYQLYDMSKYFFVKAAYDPTLYNAHGIYVQDQIKIGRFQALLGLRYDAYRDWKDYQKPTQEVVKQDAIIPRLGLVYSVTKDINLYATYSKGYNPQTSVSLTNPNAGGPFDPVKSNLIEAGAKGDFFQNRLSATLAVYRIYQENMLINAQAQGQPDLLRAIDVESKGIELDVKGQLTPDWFITLAYAYNDMPIKASTKPKEVGRQSPGAPQHQGSFWTKYTISGGVLRGIGVGAGGNFVTQRFMDSNVDQTLPAYEILNAAVYYRVDKFQIQFNLNNVLNKTHWVGGYDYLRLFPGAPRNWLTSVAYTF